MVTKLADMKVKQDLLVADKKKNVFNTIIGSATQNYRSRSAGGSIHRSVLHRNGSEHEITNMNHHSASSTGLIKFNRNNSQSGLIDMKAVS